MFLGETGIRGTFLCFGVKLGFVEPIGRMIDLAPKKIGRYHIGQSPRLFQPTLDLKGIFYDPD